MDIYNLPNRLPAWNLSRDEAFQNYWESKATYKEIQHLFFKYHDLTISVSALKRLRAKLGLRKRRGEPNNSQNEIRTAIQALQPEIPWTAGYRNVTDTLQQRGYDVRRDTVMHLMQEIDPEGIQQRRRRRLIRRVYRSHGPNQCWHMDGYDKLKPYGFAIHGAIDGYSRRVMWLEVNPSNSNPTHIALYFVQCVEQNKGCPALLTSDPGTETTECAALQCFFTEDDNSHRYVKSTANQRIEAWWCQMRRNRVEWWIEFFKELGAAGVFKKDSEIDRLAIRYAFMPILKFELLDLANRWNDHYISNGPRASCPPGRPNLLHALGDDQLMPVNEEKLEHAMTRTSRQSRSGEDEFDEYAAEFYHQQGFHDATTVDEARNQFITLLQHAK